MHPLPSRLLRRAALLLVIGAALAACSPTAGVAPSSTAASAAAGDVKVVARAVAFETRTVTAPAGRPFSLSLDNQDGALHNVAIYTDSSATRPLYVGELFTGPQTKTYAVPALAPGSYFFRCDLHPEMTGTLEAR